MKFGCFANNVWERKSLLNTWIVFRTVGEGSSDKQLMTRCGVSLGSPKRWASKWRDIDEKRTKEQNAIPHMKAIDASSRVISHSEAGHQVLLASTTALIGFFWVCVSSPQFTHHIKYVEYFFFAQCPLEFLFHSCLWFYTIYTNREECFLKVCVRYGWE